MMPFKYPQRVVLTVLGAGILLALYHLITDLVQHGHVSVIRIAHVALWAFMAWKIHTRPLRWGAVVGVLLMIGAVGRLVSTAKFADRVTLLDPTYSPNWPLIIGWESLSFLAGVCSVFLWFAYSEKPVQRADVGSSRVPPTEQQATESDLLGNPTDGLRKS